jgi:hypothetical protein
MLHRDNLNDGEPQNYAFGLQIGTYRGLPTVEHAGGDAGYRAYLVRFPDQHFSVACLCNAGPAQPYTLAYHVADIFLQPKYTEPAPPTMADDKFIELRPEQMVSKQGIYWDRDSDKVTKFVLKNGTLNMVDGDDSLPLHPLAADTFRIADFPMEVHFQGTGEGKPAEAQILNRDNKAQVYEFMPQFQLKESELKDYAGSYVSDEIDPVYRVAIESGKLMLERLKHEPQEIEPVAPDMFMASIGTLHFVREDRQQVSGFLLSTGRVRGMRFRKAEMLSSKGSATLRSH